MSLNRRKSRWAPGGLQRRIVWTALSCGVVFLLFNVQFLFTGLWIVSETPGLTPSDIIDQIRHQILYQSGILLVASIPLSLYLGLSLFKVCGPVYAFRKFFERVIGGSWDQALKIRDRDQGELHEIAEVINEGCVFRGAILSRQAAIDEVLARAELDGELRARLESLGQELREKMPERAEGAGGAPEVVEDSDQAPVTA